MRERFKTSLLARDSNMIYVTGMPFHRAERQQRIDLRSEISMASRHFGFTLAAALVVLLVALPAALPAAPATGRSG